MRKKSGMSLMSVMVGMVLLAVMAVLFSDLFVSSGRKQKLLNRNVGFGITASNINHVVRKDNTCGNAFRKEDETQRAVFGLRTPGDSSSPAIDSELHNIVSVNAFGDISVVAKVADDLESIASRRGDLFSMSLDYMRDIDTGIVTEMPQANTPAAGMTTHHAVLTIRGNVPGEMDENGAKDIYQLEKQFNLTLVTDSATNQIIGCGGRNRSSSQMIASVPLLTPSCAPPTMTSPNDVCNDQEGEIVAGAGPIPADATDVFLFAHVDTNGKDAIRVEYSLDDGTVWNKFLESAGWAKYPNSNSAWLPLNDHGKLKWRIKDRRDGTWVTSHLNSTFFEIQGYKVE